MRKRATKNGVSVSAYAGTTGILLGMNIDPEGRDGLLGFALERRRRLGREGVAQRYSVLLRHGS